MDMYAVIDVVEPLGIGDHVQPVVDYMTSGWISPSLHTTNFLRKHMPVIEPLSMIYRCKEGFKTAMIDGRNT